MPSESTIVAKSACFFDGAYKSVKGVTVVTTVLRDVPGVVVTIFVIISVTVFTFVLVTVLAFVTVAVAPPVVVVTVTDCVAVFVFVTVFVTVFVFVVVFVLVVAIVAVVILPGEVASCAAALSLTASISEITGGVTTANRPHFSRNARRSAFP
jgi:hypothetical protein